MANPNAAQQSFWSSAQGQNWIEHEDALDASMVGILDRLIEKAEIGPAQQILDIGCGTGASTRAIANAIGGQGHVTGLDISDTLLNRAQFKSNKIGLSNASYELSDAQTHPFKATHMMR